MTSFTLCLRKKDPDIIDRNLEDGLSDFCNYRCKYSLENWPSNVHSSFLLTEHLFLHYLGNTEQAKYYIFIQCSTITGLK